MGRLAGPGAGCCCSASVEQTLLLLLLSSPAAGPGVWQWPCWWWWRGCEAPGACAVHPGPPVEWRRRGGGGGRQQQGVRTESDGHVLGISYTTEAQAAYVCQLNTPSHARLCAAAGAGFSTLSKPQAASPPATTAARSSPQTGPHPFPAAERPAHICHQAAAQAAHPGPRHSRLGADDHYSPHHTITLVAVHALLLLQQHLPAATTTGIRRWRWWRGGPRRRW